MRKCTVVGACFLCSTTYLFVIRSFGWLQGLNPAEQRTELGRRISARDNIIHTVPNQWMKSLSNFDDCQARIQAAQAEPYMVCEVYPPNLFFDTKPMDCGP